MDDRLNQLVQALQAAGLPVVSVERGPPVLVWLNAATPAQQTQANAIAAGFDFRPRRPRKLADLTAAVNALTAAQKNALLAVCCADLLQRNPQAARQLGIALDGDEVAP